MTSNHSDDAPTWSQLLAREFGTNLRNARTDRAERLTAAGLAERCRELGGAMTRDRVASLEIGRRDVTLAELLTLAAALDVPPAWLVAPAGSYGDGVTEGVPGGPMSTAVAYGWVSGRRSLNHWAPPAEWDRVTGRADLAVEHLELCEHWRASTDEGPPDGRETDYARLAEVRRLMRVAGAPLPELWGPLARLVAGAEI